MNIQYSGVFLTDDSSNNLRYWWQQHVGKLLPDVLCHHMTAHFKPTIYDLVLNTEHFGKMIHLKIDSFAHNDLVQMVGVTTTISTKNDCPHITVAIDRSNGASPIDSNKLADQIQQVAGPVLFGRFGVMINNKVITDLNKVISILEK